MGFIYRLKRFFGRKVATQTWVVVVKLPDGRSVHIGRLTGPADEDPYEPAQTMVVNYMWRHSGLRQGLPTQVAWTTMTVAEFEEEFGEPPDEDQGQPN